MTYNATLYMLIPIRSSLLSGLYHRLMAQPGKAHGFMQAQASMTHDRKEMCSQTKYHLFYYWPVATCSFDIAQMKKWSDSSFNKKYPHTFRVTETSFLF